MSEVPTPVPYTESAVVRLTNRRVLLRSSVWNVLSYVAPAVVAVAAIPLLIHGLGAEAFGVIALSLAVIGSAGIFDLGIGRGLTQAVSSRLGLGETGKLGLMVWSGLSLIAVVGLAGAMVLWLGAGWITDRLQISTPHLRLEALDSLRLTALLVPFVTLSSGFRGVIEAHQKFRLSSLVRIPMTIGTLLGPVAATLLGGDVFAAVAAMAGVRFVGAVADATVCLIAIPESRRVAFSWIAARPLVGYGSWVTVNNLITPLQIYTDRFVVGSVLSLSAVAYFGAPSDMVSRIAFIPSSFAMVLFPAFATSWSGDRSRSEQLFSGGIRWMTVIVTTIALGLVALAPELLRIWLGSDFATHSSKVLQWLAIGLLLNSLGWVAIALVEGVGKPAWSAKLHLVEYIIYIPVLLLLLKTTGIVGAAIAYTVRLAVDAAGLSVMAIKLVPAVKTTIVATGRFMLAAIAIMAVVMSVPSAWIRLSIFVVAVGALAALAWSAVLRHEDRSLVMRSLRLQKVP